MSAVTKDAYVNTRVTEELMTKLDTVAAALDRKKSWVVTRALTLYLQEGEGADILQEMQGLEELRRGEGVPLSEAVKHLEVIARNTSKRHKAG